MLEHSEFKCIKQCGERSEVIALSMSSFLPPLTTDKERTGFEEAKLVKHIAEKDEGTLFPGKYRTQKERLLCLFYLF